MRRAVLVAGWIVAPVIVVYLALWFYAYQDGRIRCRYQSGEPGRMGFEQIGKVWSYMRTREMQCELPPAK